MQYPIPKKTNPAGMINLFTENDSSDDSDDSDDSDEESDSESDEE